MPLNEDKSKIIHLGKRNTNKVRIIGGRNLEVVNEEKDLGVIIASECNVGRQCAMAVKRGTKY